MTPPLLFAALLTAAPVPPAAYEANSQGVALLNRGEAAAALTSFQAARKAAPRWSAPRVNEGIALLVLGRYADALPLDPATALAPDPSRPTVFALPAPAILDGVELVAPPAGPRLPRSFDLEVSADGVAFETVALRRRRAEREDLRWVNGHPQYVLDHDVIAVALSARTVAAVRITPVASADPWGLGELLLHPAMPPGARPPWDEWLDPGLGWSERRGALASARRPDRADWYARWLIAQGH